MRRFPGGALKTVRNHKRPSGLCLHRYVHWLMVSLPSLIPAAGIYQRQLRKSHLPRHLGDPQEKPLASFSPRKPRYPGGRENRNILGVFTRPGTTLTWKFPPSWRLHFIFPGQETVASAFSSETCCGVVSSLEARQGGHTGVYLSVSCHDHLAHLKEGVYSFK